MPLAYLLTWRTYGTFLHGDAESVDRGHNSYGDARRPYSAALNRYERSKMRYPPMLLEPPMRDVIRVTIEATCVAKSWDMIAANVRTNHVHAIVGAEQPPERVLATLKAWTTRQLRVEGLIESDRPPWARHGSTRWLMTEDEVARAVVYVRDMQDDPARWAGD